MQSLRQTTGVPLTNIIGESQPMKNVKDQIRRVAPTSATVLLTGETGVGKNLLARAIHAHSDLRGGEFVQIACGSIPRELIESEIFGHEQGAFTGATKNKQGLLEAADNGTAFLDEIEDLPPDLQSKFLEFLEERTIRHLGSVVSKQLKVRVVVATNANLQEMMDAKKFRKDLFYRLEEYPILVPPLRERRPDIPLLVDHFMHDTEKLVDDKALERLRDYDWPGNVRQLRSVLSRARINAETDSIGVDGLPPAISRPASSEKLSEVIVKEIDRSAFLKPDGTLMNMEESRDVCRRAYLVTLMREAGGNVKRAHMISGTPRSNLYKLFNAYGISRSGGHK